MDNKAQFIARVAILIALTLAIQFLSLPQPITGPLVNFFLYMSVLLIGIPGGIILGAITPWIALVVGIMPLAPVVPLIMAGNIVLVIVFGLVKKVNNYLAIAVASVAKFLVLATSVRYLIQLPPKVAPKVIKLLSLPQLFTALAGGVLALVVMTILKRTKAYDQIKGQAK